MGDIQVDAILTALTHLVQLDLKSWSPNGPLAGIQVDRRRGVVTLILAETFGDTAACDAMQRAVASVPGVLHVRLAR